MRLQEVVYTLLLTCFWQAAHGQTVDPFYSGSYAITSLGSIAGVPTKYGGMVFKDANTLWVSGQATNIPGATASAPVTRGTDNHIISLGTGTVLGFGAPVTAGSRSVRAASCFIPNILGTVLARLCRRTIAPTSRPSR